MDADKFQQWHAAEARYDRRRKKAGSFLDGPSIDGKAQVPITYGVETLNKANAELETAWREFAATGTDEDMTAYFAEKKKRTAGAK